MGVGIALEGFVDVFQIGLKREGIAVAEHVEVAALLLVHLEDFGAMFDVVFDAAPVGGVDLELDGPGVIGAEGMMQGLQVDAGAVTGIADVGPELALAIDGGIGKEDRGNLELVELDDGATEVAGEVPADADVALEEFIGAPGDAGVIADDVDFIGRSLDGEAFDGEVEAGQAAADDQGRRFDLVVDDGEFGSGRELQALLKLIDGHGIDFAHETKRGLRLAVIDQNDRIIPGRFVHGDGIEIGCVRRGKAFSCCPSRH